MSLNEPLSNRSCAVRFALLLVVLLLAVALYMVSSLLTGIVAGLLLWSMTSGLYRRILSGLRGHRAAAAGLTVLATLLLVVVPVSLLIGLMAADAATLAARVQEWLAPYRPTVEARLRDFLHGGSISILNYEITADAVLQRLEQASGQIGQFLVALLQKTAGGLARTLLLVFVALYSLFYFYLDGDRFIEWLKRAVPLQPQHSDAILHSFFATSKATLKTVGIIGLMQGVLGGLAFWVCGIPAPFFWTMLMAMASVIPAVGAHIILIPAAVLLLLLGKIGFGIGLLLWSQLVIANEDTVLRPYLVKRDVHLHPLLIFLGTLGGIAAFGVLGVVLGPVIAALLVASLTVLRESSELRVDR
jgi:predicted PurR-regulated permease PerM